MEAWEQPEARVELLVLKASKEEVDRRDISHALTSLEKLLKPDIARRLKGRLIFEVHGYDDDPRELWHIPEVCTWMRRLDKRFPYWFYFMYVGQHSTLSFVAFSFCQHERTQGGSEIPPNELQRFLYSHFSAMNCLSMELCETQEENDARTKEMQVSFSHNYSH